MAFELNGANLSFNNLANIIKEGGLITIQDDTLQTFVQKEKDETPERSQGAQVFLAAHAIGFSPDIPEKVIKLALLLLTDNLLKRGNSIIQKTTLNRVVSFFNREVFPVVLSRGSAVSQVAQLALPLLGFGKVKYQGYELKAENVLEIFSWQPLRLSSDEAAFLLNESIFPQAYWADFLIQFKSYIPWLQYFSELMEALSPANIEGLKSAFKNLSARFAIITESWPATYPDQEFTSPLANQPPDSWLPLIFIFLEDLADHTQTMFINLKETAEPPGTLSFSQAASLALSLKEQIQDLINYCQNKGGITFNLENTFATTITITEQICSLSLWGISQVGKVFNLAANNLTLAAYYHSEFFVPKEMVTEQLTGTSNFIKSTTPIT